ncbi:MinD/ParA family ATP-binding protein [Methylophilus sp.]|uniref:MinD/ParA family ATP-binding protein n=1 Tax=Methylophilus sp. TaxID=29541 RepID=UPI0040357148
MFNYHDQADGLRRIMARSSARMISVMAANGQPADSWLSQLAASMAAPGKRLLLIQAHQRPMTKYTLQAVALRKSSLGRAVVKHPQGYDLACLTETDTLSSPLSGDLKIELDGIVKQLAYDYDTVMIEALFDTSDQTLALPVMAQHSLVLQVERHDEAIKSAYTTIKRICQQHGQLPLSVVVTDATHEQGQQYFMRLNQVCQQFLGISLGFLGAIPDSKAMQKAQAAAGLKNRLAAESAPATQSAMAFRAVARSLDQQRLTTSSLAAA